MLLERLYDDDLAHASYLIGCQRTGEAIVVDPRRDVQVYLDLAANHGMTITAVTETHIHADYLSGTRELAARTGATMYVSAEGGPDWQYGPGFDDAIRMLHGERIALGNLALEAVHTPGHTPEHLSFLVTDGAAASDPGWAPYLAAGDEQGFIDALLSDQPDAHAYFARMKRQNRTGPALLGELAPLPQIDASELSAALDQNSVILLDTRHHSQVHQGTVPGALNVPGQGKAASYAAWVYDPETETRPIVVLADSTDAAGRFRDHLLRVGIDAVHGFTATLDGLRLAEPKTIAPTDIEQTEHALLLDVRNRTEYNAGHIPGATQLSGGRALWHTEELPASGVILTYCQSGVRNSVVASALRRAGHDVIEIDGSYRAWLAATGTQPAVNAA